MKRDLYAEVSARIVAELEAGAAPWVKPWLPPQAPRQRGPYEPLYDINPRTGVSVQIFHTDRTLETFGRCGAGWFWWVRRRGFAPEGPATGPFATSYAAYRHAMTAAAPIGFAPSK